MKTDQVGLKEKELKEEILKEINYDKYHQKIKKDLDKAIQLAFIKKNAEVKQAINKLPEWIENKQVYTAIRFIKKELLKELGLEDGE